MTVSTGPSFPPLQGADGIFPAGCPSRTVLDHVSSKWGVLILVALWNGPQRWSELRRRAEGISEKMLAQTLKTLEGDGFLRRDAQPVIPPRVDYSLTRPRPGAGCRAAPARDLDSRARRRNRQLPRRSPEPRAAEAPHGQTQP